MAQTKFKPQQAIGISDAPPQGYMINGKIVVTVASNNITVAIKTLAGNNPSAADPVIIRIGDTVRSIVAALSVTKNAGTNYLNAGKVELAGKEVDYFVYLGYNATDGVVLGFARVPYATRYGDFSTTFSDDTYAAISTITNAASSDYYELIGRFAATNSGSASYNWSVPTFTALNLIQRPIFETRWLTWLPTYSSNGTMTYASVTGTAIYQIVNNRCNVIIFVSGTTGVADTNGIVATLPIISFAVDSCMAGMYYDGSIGGAAVGTISSSPSYNAMTFYKYNTGNWGLGANRSPRITTFYRLI